MTEIPGTDETRRGQQAEQAGYEQTKAALESLEVDQASVEMWLSDAKNRPPEQVVRGVSNFEGYVRSGRVPARADGQGEANAATIMEIRRQMRALAGMPPPEPIAPPPPAEILRCRCCGQSGVAGRYPFSTLPDSGLCDDCL